MFKELVWMLRYPARNAVSPYRIISSVGHSFKLWKRFWKSYFDYYQLNKLEANSFNRQDLLQSIYPCLGEDTSGTEIEPTYFYQDAWAFERIFQQNPDSHIDVGSHHKFVALLSKVLPVTMIDIRPLSLPLNSLKFKQGSILDLPYEDQSVESLSSLCVIEHIGLGRYGDPLDPYGTEKAISELKRVIKPNGNIYISVPIEEVNKTYFNAHRAFNENYIFKLFAPFEILDAKYICGNEFREDPTSGFCIGCYHMRNPTIG